MRRSLQDLHGVEKDSYTGLPEELKEFNYFIPDCGNVIMAMPECLLKEAEENGDLDMFECPFPVKYVLEKGYRIYKDHVICNGRYDMDTGLQIEERYYEYNRPSKSSGNKEDLYTDDLVSTLNGQIVPAYIGLPQGALFTMSNSGASLAILVKNPTEKEIAQFDEAKPVEIRFSLMKDVIMVTSKFGDLSWRVSPYTIHLNKQLTRMFSFAGGESFGIKLTVVLINVGTGKIEKAKVVQLPFDFSMQLYIAIMEQKKMEFSDVIYDENVNRILKMYTADQLAEMATARCRIG